MSYPSETKNCVKPALHPLKVPLTAIARARAKSFTVVSSANLLPPCTGSLRQSTRRQRIRALVFVHKHLSIGHHPSVDCVPERGLLLPGGQREVLVVLSQLGQQDGQPNAVLAVFLLPLNGHTAKSAGTIIGGGAVHIQRKDHIIDGNRNSMGKGQTFLQGNAIGHCTVPSVL